MLHRQYSNSVCSKKAITYIKVKAWKWTQEKVRDIMHVKGSVVLGRGLSDLVVTSLLLHDFSYPRLTGTGNFFSSTFVEPAMKQMHGKLSHKLTLPARVFNYNLGQNKIRNRTTLPPLPPPPRINEESALNQIVPFFHHWNGGRGGFNFSFTSSKIVVCIALNYPMWGCYK